jgi:hypothetical protein
VTVFFETPNPCIHELIQFLDMIMDIHPESHGLDREVSNLVSRFNENGVDSVKSFGLIHGVPE